MTIKKCNLENIKLICSLCGSTHSVCLYPTPVDVVVDSNGNILWVVEAPNLPYCRKCAQFLGLKNSKYSWIERIFKVPFVDGRKRITDLVLMPYLANVRGLSEEEAVAKIRQWFVLCKYDEKQYGKKLQYQYWYVLKRRLLPLRFSNFLENLAQYSVNGGREWRKK
jgi:hypothetical protein